MQVPPLIAPGLQAGKRARLLAAGITLAGSLAAQIPPPPGPPPSSAPILQQRVQVEFSGSIPQGQATSAAIDLTLRDAIDRGLKYNLGVLLSSNETSASRAARLRNLSALLPTFYLGAQQNVNQTDLVAFGLKLPGIPTIVGPYSYQDARGYVQQTIYDRTTWKNLRSSQESVKASQFNTQNSRDLVVQAVSNAYLSILTNAARADAVQADVNTAQVLFDRAADQKRAGTIPAIDVLRAQVQLKSQQQRLLAQRNQVEKDKLVLARAIGLPPGQVFRPTDSLPYSPVQATLDDLVKQAYDNRADFQSARANLRAAQLAVDAAHGERWPSFNVDANYGITGETLRHSHGNFGFQGAVRFPVFEGGRIRADIEQAETSVVDRKNVLEDLRGRIDFDVRSALLDLQSAADQVEVARTNVDLATQTLTQARDRFTAGVTDNLEVVQAQQTLATANQDYITALSSHNSAKIALATALGVADQGVPKFLNLKP